MKFFTSSIVAAALVIAQVQSKPVNGSLCKGGQAVALKTVDHVINGSTVSLINYRCPQGFVDGVNAASATSVEVSAHETSLHLAARQFGACTVYPGPPQCQSATPCTQARCQTHTAKPITNDCYAIGSYLLGLAGTFLTAPSSYWSLPYGTCDFRWANLQAAQAEYAYANWGQLGANVFYTCGVLNAYTDGFCLPANALWFAQTASPTTPLP